MRIFTGLVWGIFLSTGCTGKECGEGTHDEDGTCVGDAPSDSGQDADGDTDADADADADADTGVDTPWDCSDMYTDSQLLTVNSGRTYSIDLTTAHVEEIADYSAHPDRPSDPNSAAFAPEGIAWVSDSGENRLLMLDVCEADIIPIGPTGFGHLCGISYGSDGMLYGMDSNTNSLVQLDQATGAGTIIGALGRNIDNCGLTLDCLSGTLYGLDGKTGQLFTIDPITGTAGTPVNLNLSNMPSVGLEFDPMDGSLLMTNGPTLYRVNPATGALTTIGPFDLGSGFNDLAFHLGPLPCDD